jgi:hypothetical protein
MQDGINKPIFVVGSPRSGTSILTWCLGHHPNLFPVPESNWMGDFAANVAIAHQIGAARGNLSILSAMDIREDELFTTLGQSINDLILYHRGDLERKREMSSRALKLDPRWFEATSTAAGPKTRWVDGTPEYSFHICGLRKLFPGALFIHVVRDVSAVVRSMLNFHRVAGTRLVTNEEEAYKYWLRTVSACLEAERAYGPREVYRLPYATLIDKPEAAIRLLLDFVGEPYSANCLEALAQRINSSNAPPDFRSTDSATDPAVVEEARRLSAEIENTSQPNEASPAVADEMEAEFGRRVKYIATLDAEKSRLESALESAIGAYQAEQLRLGSAIKEIQQQLAQANDQISQLNGQLDRKNISLAERDKLIAELTGRLQRQLCDTRKLSHLLDNVEQAAERLRRSRRWKLANPQAAIKAKLSGRKVIDGYGHLDKIVAAYSHWRVSHPEVVNVDDEIKSA